MLMHRLFCLSPPKRGEEVRDLPGVVERQGIKEVNPDEVKGSATGAINFLTFGVTAAIGPVFAGRFGKTLGAQTVDSASHFRHAGLFWIGILIAALVVGSMLRETGGARPNQAA